MALAWLTYLVQSLYGLCAAKTEKKGFDSSLCHVLALTGNKNLVRLGAKLYF